MQTCEGRRLWRALEACARQLRIGPSGVVGLDFASVFALCDASGVDRAELAEVLPFFERCLVLYYSGDEESGPSEDSD